MPAGLQPVLAIDRLEPRLELTREPRDAADNADRRVIELRPLAPPLLDDQVDAVALNSHSRSVSKFSSRELASQEDMY